MARDYDPRKWWDKRPNELSWESDRHAWFWYISQHWHYTGLSSQALVNWLAMYRFAGNVRYTVSGYPRSFFKGLPDKTGAKSRAHRRAVAELVAAGLIRAPRPHQYDLSPAMEFAFALHKKVEDARTRDMLADMDEFDPCEDEQPYEPDFESAGEP
jgi:hypothetical protein